MDRSKPQQPPRLSSNLLWNPENVKDVAEAVGVPALPDDSVRFLAQDVEYRIGQILVDALRFMRMSHRSILTVSDLKLAFRVHDVQPLYGYQTSRPLRYGEASLGPGQPLFYMEDDEVDFEKLINMPLPKVPRDASVTAHWLAIDGVQPSIPQNPTTAESRSHDILAKGSGANPALAALAGNENTTFKPAVKHIISKELVIYFEKVLSALLGTSRDAETERLRSASLESIREDPGLQPLVPYFVNFISDQITHRLDDLFCMHRILDLVTALLQNSTLFLDPYATTLSQAMLTCLMGRKPIGSSTNSSNGTHSSDVDKLKSSYELRDYAAMLLGRIASKFANTNAQLRPKIGRACLKTFLNVDKAPATHYGAVRGIGEVGGAEFVRVVLLPSLKEFDNNILATHMKKNPTEAQYLLEAIVKVLESMVTPAERAAERAAGSTHIDSPDARTAAILSDRIADAIGPRIGRRIASTSNLALFDKIFSAKPTSATHPK